MEDPLVPDEAEQQPREPESSQDEAGEERLAAEADDGEEDQDEPAASGGATASSDNPDDAGDEKSASFECNICLDVARDAVISLCGHLFCWPCLHQWLETRPQRQICPVCKAGISADKVIPLYGRGNTEQKDPRAKKVPPRPRGQRPEPENNARMGAGIFSPFGVGNQDPGGFQMSFGIGAFPFGFFATNFNLGGPGEGAYVRHPHGSAQMEEEQFLSKVFLWIALAFIVWLMMA